MNRCLSLWARRRAFQRVRLGDDTRVVALTINRDSSRRAIESLEVFRAPKNIRGGEALKNDYLLGKLARIGSAKIPESTSGFLLKSIQSPSSLRSLTHHAQAIYRMQEKSGKPMGANIQRQILSKFEELIKKDGSDYRIPALERFTGFIAKDSAALLRIADALGKPAEQSAFAKEVYQNDAKVDPNTVRQLARRYLESPDRNLSESSAIVLAMKGESIPLVHQKLASALGNEGWEVRRDAVRALARVKSGPEEENLLLLQYAKDRDSDVRNEAQVAIRAMKLTNGNLSAVQTIAQSGEWERRKFAQELAATVPTHEAARILVSGLGDKDSDVRAAASTGLEKYKIDGPEMAALNELSASLQEDTRQQVIHFAQKNPSSEGTALIGKFQSDQSWEVRRQVVRALSVRKDAGSTQVLIKLVGDRDSDVRKVAIDGLSGRAMGDVEIEQVRLMVDGTTDADSRKAAIELASRNSGSKATELLGVLLQSQNWEVRRDTANALERRRDAGSTKLLIGAIGDSDSDVRNAAEQGLGNHSIGAAELKSLEDLVRTSRQADTHLKAAKVGAKDKTAAGTAFLGSMRADQNWEARKAVAEALGSRRDVASGTHLLAMLQDRDSDVRNAARSGVYAAGRSFTGENVKWIGENLSKSRDWEARKESATLLGIIRSPESLRILQGMLLTEQDRDVQGEIRASLQKFQEAGR